ncbi:hypothetical protein BJX66DRAFT_345555 [Aspergillus keveii]|uniref:Major facilitator superfamily (MFS) profile domain-containing protein n=1 Tax=Aspergillus keveii TaxID=714993 RepID=A0ABR4FHN2_9EURO
MAVYAFIGNFSAKSIASAFPLYATPLAFNPPVSMGRLSHLVAVTVLMMGAANIWWVPLANTFGRRPITLINILLLVFSSMWVGLATSFETLLAARFFMGLLLGLRIPVGLCSVCRIGLFVDFANGIVAPNVIGEIYFTHQRGKAMGFYTVFLCVGFPFGGIMGGYIGVTWAWNGFTG